MENSKPKKMRSYRFHQKLLEALDDRVEETGEDKTDIIERGLQQELLESGHLKEPIPELD
jgi:hypothetical protein